MTGVSLVALGHVIREAVPPWLVPAFVVITRLGNTGLLLALFSLDYWFGDHERGAHALGLALGGMALITALKALFAVPRPPEAGRLVTVTSYSFPSGHATAATIGYGILAYDLEVSTRRIRFAVAAVLVALIATSRVVLGVHFVRDVVAGVAVGVAFLGATIVLTGHRPRPGFLLGVALGLAALVVSGGSPDGVGAFGATVGAALAWETLDAIPSVASFGARVVLVGGVLPAAGGLGYAASYWALPLAVVFVLAGTATAAIVTAPRFLSRFE